MMQIYDVFGLNASLSEAAALVESALSIQLVAYSSDYVGDHYGTAIPDDTIDITANVIDDEGELLEPDFPEYNVIVEVCERPDADTIVQKLTSCGFRHLLRELIDDGE